MDDKWIKEVLEFDDDTENREFSDADLTGDVPIRNEEV